MGSDCLLPLCSLDLPRPLPTLPLSLSDTSSLLYLLSPAAVSSLRQVSISLSSIFFIALDACARVCLFELLFLDSIPFALFSYIPLYYSSVSKKDRWLGFRISRLLFAAMLLL